MIKGSIPALITPFKNGEIDKNALEDLVEWQIEEGSNGLVAVGTTGESPTLSHEEHQEVIEIIVKKSKGRVPVIAGAGSNNTRESVDLMKFAKKVGADAALIVTPYYNKPKYYIYTLVVLMIVVIYQLLFIIFLEDQLWIWIY